jgi:signal transduction histidine kinase
VMRDSKSWQWFVSFHYDSSADWIFLVARRAYWVYAPFVFFVLSFLGVVLLILVPYQAAEKLRREETAGALANFASRVDNFIRGRDPALYEPPHAYKALAPIVHAARWLVPQWKKAEAFPRELALERKLLALLIESLPEGILFFNEKGALQLSNELGRVFLSLHQEGKEARMVTGVQVPRGFLEPYLEPVFTGTQPNLGKEVDVSWADGKHLYRIWVERVDTDPGKVMGYIAVIRDITFRKQWEYVQEQVLSGITHDLRGPLSAVMGYMDLVRRQLGDSGPPKVLDYLKMAREGGLRLSQMVNDILDVVRFEQGKIEMSHEAVPVGEIFERLKNTFGVIAEQKKVNLRVSIPGDPNLRIWGDRKLLERVFDNLVGNAIKFTPAAGDITVTAVRKSDRTIFEVVDTGRGIPREAQSRIFDKFQQVRPGDRSSGYGLGLAVAKFIVEAHKGEIRVESEVEAGSRFSFWIPNVPANASRGGLNELPPDSMDPNSLTFPPAAEPPAA